MLAIILPATNTSIKDYNCAWLGMDAFPGSTEETAQRPIQWLRKHCGIRCHKLSSYCAGFNFCNSPNQQNHSELEEAFVIIIRTIYNIFWFLILNIPFSNICLVDPMPSVQLCSDAFLQLLISNNSASNLFNTNILFGS